MSRTKIFLYVLPFICALVFGFFIKDMAMAIETKGGHIGYTKQAQKPEEFGNILIDNNSSSKGLKPVVFPHWVHRMNYTCKVCHTDLGFQMKAGEDNITMKDIFQGKWCGTCHNGEIAFKPLICKRCHSYGIDVPENKSSTPEKYFSKLTRDPYGNGVNWVKSVIDGKSCPKGSLDGKKKMFIFDKDVEFKMPESAPLPDVVFPHKNHTMFLHCSNCHPRVFKMKKGANKMGMPNVFAGKYCGVCHERVAFPFEDCFRCHSKGFRTDIKPEGAIKGCATYSSK